MTQQRKTGARGETRARILDAARALFARDGYAGMRLDELAEVVGIRRPSLFYHFKDKPTLYREVWAQAIAEQDAFLAPHFERADLTPEVLLDIAADAWVDYAFEHRDFVYMSLFAVAAGRAEDFPRGMSVATLHRWQQLLDCGVERGVFNPVPLADCMALIGGMTSFYLTIPDNGIPVLMRGYDGDRTGFAGRLKQLLRALILLPTPPSAQLLALKGGR